MRLGRQTNGGLIKMYIAFRTVIPWSLPVEGDFSEASRADLISGLWSNSEHCYSTLFYSLVKQCLVIHNSVCVWALWPCNCCVSWGLWRHHVLTTNLDCSRVLPSRGGRGSPSQAPAQHGGGGWPVLTLPQGHPHLHQYQHQGLQHYLWEEKSYL